MHKAGAEAHVPVLRDRCVELLSPALQRPGSVLVDATLGSGGHSLALLEAVPDFRLIGLDRDEDALGLAQSRLAAHAGRVTLVHAVYDEMSDICADLGLDRVHAVLFDLGVSSMQLDQAGRGFSYAHDAPLDMRMDQSQGPSAADVVNTYSRQALARVLRVYGEEPFAGPIADALIRRRAKQPFSRTGELVDVIRDTIPAPARRTGGNPAKRTFQALRIEVNGELDALDAALPQAINLLGLGGRIVVMAYQSLEDRLVKQTLAAGATSRAPADLPVEPEQAKPYLRLLTRGAARPEAEEIASNPRSASVRLRAAERIRHGQARPVGKAGKTAMTQSLRPHPGRRSGRTRDMVRQPRPIAPWPGGAQ